MSISTHTATRRLLSAVGFATSVAACFFVIACSEDSVVGNDEAFMPEREDENPNNDGGTSSCEMPPTGPSLPVEPNDCDLSGTWIAQQYTISLALGTAEALSYNWYYYELEDNGDYVTATRSWDCGFSVCGNVTQIQLTQEQTEALALANRQDGILLADPENPLEPISEEARVLPREIMFKKKADGVCEFSMERWWSVRSAPLEYFPPRDQYSTMEIHDVQQYKALPTPDVLTAEWGWNQEQDSDNSSIMATRPEWDWDGNKEIGLHLQLDKPIVGSRDSIQRDWAEVPPVCVADGVTDFTVPAEFDNEEMLYKWSSSLLKAVSKAERTRNTIRFIKIEDKAPETVPEFIEFCEEQVAQYFLRDNPQHYCDFPKQGRSHTGLEVPQSDTDE